jgi:hypothetical protein
MCSSGAPTMKPLRKCRWRKLWAVTLWECQQLLKLLLPAKRAWKFLGLSLITNLAAGISPHPLSHQEVVDAGRDAEPVISALLAKIILAL